MTDTATMLRVALDAAARGWHVFPLRPGDKRPVLHGADRCPRTGACTGGHVGWEQRATTDPERIRRCWSVAPFNVGIATGPSGLVVLDLDTPKPGQDTPPEEWRLDGVHDGADVFAVVCERAGQPAPLDTYTVTTGRGGTHLYYRHPDTGPQLRNTTGGTAGSLGWLIDTRAHGGYVVAAGSIVNGRRYTLAHDTTPAPLPDWLAARLRPAPLPPPPAQPVRPTTAGRSRYLAAAIAAEVARVEQAPEGQRNQALYLAAVALGQLVAGGALTEAEVRDVLTQAAAGHLAAGAYSPRQAERTIASGLRAGAKRPRSVAA